MVKWLQKSGFPDLSRPISEVKLDQKGEPHLIAKTFYRAWFSLDHVYSVFYVGDCITATRYSAQPDRRQTWSQRLNAQMLIRYQ